RADSNDNPSTPAFRHWMCMRSAILRPTPDDLLRGDARASVFRPPGGSCAVEQSKGVPHVRPRMVTAMALPPSRPPSRRRSRRLRVELLEERCVPAPVVSVLPIAPQAGAPFSGPVATFTDPANPSAVPVNFAAAIDWGDGTGTDTSTPVVTL